jgi:hypothetical protein
MKKVQITSRLIGKEELFRILALSYSCPISLPVLLIGDPGTGKSNAITDFLGSVYASRPDLVYSIQLSDFTKGSDITGRIDIGHLVKHNEVQFSRPICRAAGIYIDEVGRGSSGVRNTLLSIMNEKKIISGDDSCDLIWELFVGSTNTIPTEETGDAFWDRFIVKYTVNQASPDEMSRFLANPAQTTRELCIPEKADMDSVTFNPDHLKVFVELIKAKNLLTDRTISKIPDIAKCVKVIWELGTNEEALGQTAKLICSSISDELMTKIVSPKQRDLNDKLNLLKTTTSAGRIINILTALSNLETELCFNQPFPKQQEIKDHIRTAILNSGNEVAIDKYLAQSDNVAVVDFVFGSK